MDERLAELLGDDETVMQIDPETGGLLIASKRPGYATRLARKFAKVVLAWALIEDDAETRRMTVPVLMRLRHAAAYHRIARYKRKGM